MPTGRTDPPAQHPARDLGPTRLKFPKGEAAKRYNVLQKLTYLVVVFVLLPLMVATGLTMSPGFDAIAPWLLDLFGGRQSARTIHFITRQPDRALRRSCTWSRCLLAGVWNKIRSMITGRYVVPSGGRIDEQR